MRHTHRLSSGRPAALPDCRFRAVTLFLSFAQKLVSLSDVFQLQDSQAAADHPPALTLAPQHTTTEARTQAVAGVLAELRDKHGLLSGWRDELYPVTPAFDAEPLLLIERAAAPYFGIRAYGVHVNGYVVQADGRKALWVARRSASKQTWPGKLDHIVAGGQVRACLAASRQGKGEAAACLVGACLVGGCSFGTALCLTPHSRRYMWLSHTVGAAHCVGRMALVCSARSLAAEQAVCRPTPASALPPRTCLLSCFPPRHPNAALRADLCRQRRQGVLGGGGRPQGARVCSVASRLCELRQHV